MTSRRTASAAEAIGDETEVRRVRRRVRCRPRIVKQNASHRWRVGPGAVSPRPDRVKEVKANQSVWLLADAVHRGKWDGIVVTVIPS